jgi:hypothetical protein
MLLTVIKLSQFILWGMIMMRNVMLYFTLFVAFFSLQGSENIFDPTRFDVVIVCHYKDYETLPLCIESVKKNITYQNPHNRIFVIGNKEIQSPDFTFVHENKFYKFIHPCDMQKKWGMFNKSLSHRSFWVFQQFLKLGAFLIIDDLAENYLHVDADTIWLRPQRFLTDDTRIIYSEGDHFYKPYMECYKRVLNEDTLKDFCFTHHHFMWNQVLLKELFAQIETIHHKPWYKAIFDCIDYNEPSSHSEDELWGHWLLRHHPERLYFEPLNAIDIDKIPDQKALSKFKKYDFVTAHWYMRHNNRDLPDLSPCAAHKTKANLSKEL